MFEPMFQIAVVLKQSKYRPFAVYVHMVQKHLAGEQIAHWDIQNKRQLS